jgi:Flp pilus assembly CpaE family ATPase
VKEAAMSESPGEPFEVLCPCCDARLRVDPETKAVLSHEVPPEERKVKDLTQAMMGLKAEAAQRQARFEESLKLEKSKKGLLDRKFQDALKRTKDAPVSRPIRDIDLD